MKRFAVLAILAITSLLGCAARPGGPSASPAPTMSVPTALLCDDCRH